MPKFWAPVLALYAPEVTPVSETYNFFIDGTNTENGRPEVDLSLDQFSGNFGTTNKLVAVVHGYYDTDAAAFRKKITYTNLAGDAAALDPSGAGSHAWTAWVNQITPASLLTGENSLYLPLCVYSIKAGDAIAATYGSNGIGGTTIGTYNSISRRFGGSGGVDPAQPNYAKNVELYLDDADFSLGGGTGTKAGNMFFQHYGDAANKKWRGISCLTGAWAPGLNPSGADAGMNGLGTAAEKWFRHGLGVKAPGVNRALSALGATSLVNGDGTVNVPMLSNIVPGDAFPFAMLLLGRNADGGPAAHGGVASDGYVFTPGDFVGGTDKILDFMHIACQFDKVDMVWDTCNLTGFA